ncbi:MULTISPECIES: PEP-CTERM sorting domain-containing protein [unclassified Coleofasciculus]|uniref:PEP-CTERM sorting domain-containing protein n=1 Tax=Cyanophyceae TaxID=3028117 RepID=UPI0016837546|nr:MULTISPECIES: PEP-CTERM sorting domain-containing protein [unclassified Coleofasciculus]MBD1897424.1 PEP-CTERM sorting domain-containing protein [Coleofasciculus sp. FACHB-129]MBD2540515.1 PEP-CTERM sorting domain-containing protein [Coleofasciculus sp. FACHB-SPT36]
MSTSTMWKKLSIAVSAAFLALGTVNLAPANAITFNFQGNLDGDSVEGTYTVADEILDLLVSDVRIGNYLDVKNPFDFFSLSVNGNNIFSGKPSDSSLTSLIPVNQVFAFREVLRLNVKETNLDFQLSVATADQGPREPVSQCLVKECQGFTVFTAPGVNGYGFVSHKPVNVVESVPEPTAAIALGVIGASMLIRKRKLSSSPQA